MGARQMRGGVQTVARAAQGRDRGTTRPKMERRREELGIFFIQFNQFGSFQRYWRWKRNGTTSARGALERSEGRKWRVAARPCCKSQACPGILWNCRKRTWGTGAERGPRQCGAYGTAAQGGAGLPGGATTGSG